MTAKMLIIRRHHQRVQQFCEQEKIPYRLYAIEFSHRVKKSARKKPKSPKVVQAKGG